MFSPIIAESQKALAETLANALQGLRYQRVPTAKLSRFYGQPRGAGEPTLGEWLEEVQAYCRQLGLNNAERVAAALDHLAGVAREEIYCSPPDTRQDWDKLVKVLNSRFGSRESVQSLNSAFYARTQLEGESLSDFGRALMICYNQVEAAAADSQEAEALTRLREKALRAQFVKGAARPDLRRELRRLEMDYPDYSFFEFRDLAVRLLQELDDVGGDPSRDIEPVVVNKVTAGGADQKALDTLVNGQAQLIKVMESVLSNQEQTSKAIADLGVAVNRLAVRAEEQKQSSRPVPRCAYCKKRGHAIETCYKRQNDETRRAGHSSSSEVTQPNSTPQPSSHSSSGNAPPLS